MPRRPVLVLASALASLLALPAARAHYPMLEADRAVVDPGAEVTVELGVGHPFANDRFRCDAPLTVQLYVPGIKEGLLVTDKLQEVGTEALPRRHLRFAADKQGDYILATRSVFVEPPQRQIEDYAKVFVHVRGKQLDWDRVLGEPMELVPLTRPYALPVGATFRGRALEHGKPVPEGAIEAETYARNGVPEPFPELAEYRRWEKTDKEGYFSITLDQPGWWLLSCATDGGPGQQGGSSAAVKRAVMWLFVGPWEEKVARRFAPPAKKGGLLPPPAFGPPGFGPPGFEPPSWGPALAGWALLLLAGALLARGLRPAPALIRA